LITPYPALPTPNKDTTMPAYACWKTAPWYIMNESMLLRCRRVFCCGALLGLLIEPGPVALSAATAATGAPASGTFVALSDLHFNPFFDPTLVAELVGAGADRWQGIFESSTVQGVGSYGSDTDYPLLRSTLAAAASAAPEPDFVLITGDFLGHHFPQLFAQYSPGSSPAVYRRFVQKTMQFVTARLRAAFPRARVISALGNNDSDCGDYTLRPWGSFLAGLERLWQPLLGPVAGSFRRTFPVAGYYSLPHPTVPHLEVAVLNTVLFSPKYKSCSKGPDMSERELRWLEGLLRGAARRGDKVWLIYHIPPGIDAYATLGATGPCRGAPVMLWRAGVLSRFWSILARYPGVVKAGFAGHTHMDELRLPPVGGFVHVTPAVSPLFGNNPGFAVFSYSVASGEVADVRTWYLDLPANAANAAKGDSAAGWAQEYDFQQAYAQPAIDGSALAAVQRAIACDAAVRDRYMTFYPVSSASSSTDLAHWLAYWCAAQTFTPESFADCYCPAAPGG
jgi:sphingomyelin phosphodiesterase acid-like 3